MARWVDRIFRISFVTLPYWSYLSAIALIVVAFITRTRQRQLFDPLTRNSLAILGGLLILASCVAENRAEAFLQLANFLPFFLFFSILPYLLQGAERLATLATDMVMVAIPLNLLALGEYILKSPWIPRMMRRIPYVRSLRNGVHKGRAMLMFNHPNALANYLVVILGLGLGLILAEVEAAKSPKTLWHEGSKPRQVLLYIGTGLTLVGIFCSGSRNGLIVAIAEILVFCLCIQSNRRILWSGLLGLAGLVISAIGLGLGRRSLSLFDWANDPRPRVWGIAWDLIQERPWWGWGLGNYKLEYLPRLLERYPHCVVERTYKVIPAVCDDVTHPHNFWLLLTAETGIGITLLMTIWVGWLCGRSLRVNHSPVERSVLHTYLFAFGGCVAFALLDVTFYDVRLNAIHWMLLAGIYRLSQRRLPPSLAQSAGVVPHHSPSVPEKPGIPPFQSLR